MNIKDLADISSQYLRKPLEVNDIQALKVCMVKFDIINYRGVLNSIAFMDSLTNECVGYRNGT